jgi:hypothetical protein
MKTITHKIYHNNFTVCWLDFLLIETFVAIVLVFYNVLSIVEVRGPFEKFVDWQQCAAVMLLCLPLYNNGKLPPVHELFKRLSWLLCHPKKGSFKMTITQPLTTVRGMKITLLLCYPHHYNLV